MWRALVIVILTACGATTGSASRRFAYPAPPHVGDLVTDAAQFAPYAASLRRDLEADLAAAPPPAAARTKNERFVLAMLDALDDRWADAVAELDRVRAVETDRRAQVMTGLSIRIWADALAHDGDFEAALDRGLAALPLELVRPDLSMLRAMGQVFTPAVCRELTEQAIGARTPLGLDDAQTIVFQRYAVVRLVQVGPVIDRVLAAHGVALPTQ